MKAVVAQAKSSRPVHLSPSPSTWRSFLGRNRETTNSRTLPAPAVRRRGLILRQEATPGSAPGGQGNWGAFFGKTEKTLTLQMVAHGLKEVKSV